MRFSKPIGSIILASTIFISSGNIIGASKHFTDTKGHWAESYISRLSEKGIVNGYENNTFKPNQSIDREEVAQLIFNYTGQTSVTQVEVPFDAKNRWSSKAIVHVLGIKAMKGYDDGSFKPDAKLTRAELATVVYNVLSNSGTLSDYEVSKASFNDIQDHFAKASIETLAGIGLLKGYSDGSFKPDAYVTRAEVAKVMAFLTKSETQTVNLKPAAVQGDWVYHFAIDRSQNQPVSGLYKTKLDNSEKVLLSKDAGYNIILDGDWIYYANVTSDDTRAIYRIKTDGTNRTKLADDSIMTGMDGEGSQIQGDWLYYISAKDEFSLYRVKKDGGPKEKLTNGMTYSFIVNNGWIYYSKDSSVYRMKQDKTENKLIIKESGSILDIFDDSIYFVDEKREKLKKFNLDGSGAVDLNIKNVYSLKANKDWIYYNTNPIPSIDNQIYRAKTDGSNIEKLTEDDSFFMQVEDEWIYYISMDMTNQSFKLNRMKLDGTDKTTFKTEGIFAFLNW